MAENNEWPSPLSSDEYQPNTWHQPFADLVGGGSLTRNLRISDGLATIPLTHSAETIYRADELSQFGFYPYDGRGLQIMGGSGDFDYRLAEPSMPDTTEGKFATPYFELPTASLEQFFTSGGFTILVANQPYLLLPPEQALVAEAMNNGCDVTCSAFWPIEASTIDPHMVLGNIPDEKGKNDFMRSGLHLYIPSPHLGEVKVRYDQKLASASQFLYGCYHSS